MKKITIFAILIINSFLSHAQSGQPKLIVQLVVDQLRGDLIQQHRPQFGSNGFNYLLNHAIDYHNAHHPHANTTTCAGHATIATGSYPSLHGVIDNDWYDRKSRQLVYCMEDLTTHILPTIHTKKIIPGRSPRNLKQSTLSDEIILSTKGRAFGVSLKDRAAITLAGHSGKAFWFDKTNGGFVTSAYYYANYPQWVTTWNSNFVPKSYDWQLNRAKPLYQNSKNKPFKHDYQGFGQDFPHHVLKPESEDYYKFLSRTPKADQIVGEFAALLLAQEKLGQTENQTDYLAISFSATDAIGHQFGPNSLESEDNLLALDHTIASLLQAIDKAVGLKNTVIVLTADHGVSDSPSYLKSHSIHEIKPVNTETLDQFIVNQLSQHFHLPKTTLMSVTPPYIYLDHQIINDHHLNLSEVNHYLVASLNTQPGIFRAFSLPITYIEKDWLSAKVDRMAYPERAGDIYLVQPPYQSHGAKNEDRVAHGSPWQYDTYVPLLFVSPHFKPQRLFRPVYTTDIASTLSALLMIKSPSGAVGTPLLEVIDAFNEKTE